VVWLVIATLETFADSLIHALLEHNHSIALTLLRGLDEVRRIVRVVPLGLGYYAGLRLGVALDGVAGGWVDVGSAGRGPRGVDDEGGEEEEEGGAHGGGGCCGVGGIWGDGVAETREAAE
jgi:hypothetical protein